MPACERKDSARSQEHCRGDCKSAHLSASLGLRRPVGWGGEGGEKAERWAPGNHLRESPTLPFNAVLLGWRACCPLGTVGDIWRHLWLAGATGGMPASSGLRPGVHLNISKMHRTAPPQQRIISPKSTAPRLENPAFTSKAATEERVPWPKTAIILKLTTLQ